MCTISKKYFRCFNMDTLQPIFLYKSDPDPDDEDTDNSFDNNDENDDFSQASSTSNVTNTSDTPVSHKQKNDLIVQKVEEYFPNNDKSSSAKRLSTIGIQTSPIKQLLLNNNLNRDQNTSPSSDNEERNQSLDHTTDMYKDSGKLSPEPEKPNCHPVYYDETTTIENMLHPNYSVHNLNLTSISNKTAPNNQNLEEICSESHTVKYPISAENLSEITLNFDEVDFSMDVSLSDVIKRLQSDEESTSTGHNSQNDSFGFIDHNILGEHQKCNFQSSEKINDENETLAVLNDYQQSINQEIISKKTLYVKVIDDDPTTLINQLFKDNYVEIQSTRENETKSIKRKRKSGKRKRNADDVNENIQEPEKDQNKASINPDQELVKTDSQEVRDFQSNFDEILEMDDSDCEIGDETQFTKFRLNNKITRHELRNNHVDDIPNREENINFIEDMKLYMRSQCISTRNIKSSTITKALSHLFFREDSLLIFRVQQDPTYNLKRLIDFQTSNYKPLLYLSDWLKQTANDNGSKGGERLKAHAQLRYCSLYPFILVFALNNQIYLKLLKSAVICQKVL